MEIESNKKEQKIPHSRQEIIRQNIVRDFYENGPDFQELAARYDREVRSIRRTINTYNRRKKTDRKRGSGRKKGISKDSKIKMRIMLKKNPFKTCQEIVNELDLDCSRRTVNNYLNQSHFSYRTPDIKPELTEDQKVERVDFAKVYQSQDFSRMIFTDECGITTSVEKQKGWFPKGQFKPIYQSINYERVNVWAGISIAGKISIDVYPENLDSNRYISILKGKLIPNVIKLYYLILNRLISSLEALGV